MPDFGQVKPGAQDNCSPLALALVEADDDAVAVLGLLYGLDDDVGPVDRYQGLAIGYWRLTSDITAQPKQSFGGVRSAFISLLGYWHLLVCLAITYQGESKLLSENR